MQGRATRDAVGPPAILLLLREGDERERDRERERGRERERKRERAI